MKTEITDEQLIDIYMKNQEYAIVGRAFGITRQAVEQRIRRMQLAGVNLPDSNRSNMAFHYTPERVRELNLLVASYVDKQG